MAPTTRRRVSSSSSSSSRSSTSTSLSGKLGLASSSKTIAKRSSSSSSAVATATAHQQSGLPHNARLESTLNILAATNSRRVAAQGPGFIKADAEVVQDNIQPYEVVSRRAPGSSQPSRHHTKHSLEHVLAGLLDDGTQGGHWDPQDPEQFVITAGRVFAAATGRSSWQSLDKILKNMGLLKVSVDIRTRSDQRGSDRAVRVFRYFGPSHLGYSFKRGDVTLLPRRAGSLRNDPVNTMRWRDPVTKLLTEALAIPSAYGSRKDPTDAPARSTVLPDDMKLKAVDFVTSPSSISTAPIPTYTTSATSSDASHASAPVPAAWAGPAETGIMHEDHGPIVKEEPVSPPVEPAASTSTAGPVTSLLNTMYGGNTSDMWKDLEFLSQSEVHSGLAQQAMADLQSTMWSAPAAASQASASSADELAQSLESPTSAISWSPSFSPSPVPSYTEADAPASVAQEDALKPLFERKDSLKILLDATFSQIYSGSSSSAASYP